MSTASDYAAVDIQCVDGVPMSVYYGYEYSQEIATEECPLPDDESPEQSWGCLIRRDNQIIFAMAYQDLVSVQGRRAPGVFECQDCLLLGIGLYFAGQPYEPAP